MADFLRSLAIVLVNEGGSTFTNRAEDKGGPTRYGISLATLAAFRKKPVTEMDVRTLTEQEARVIYEANYWSVLKCAQYGSQALATSVFDAGVLTGTSNAARMLQQAVGATVDGQIGSKSIAAINSAESGAVIALFSTALQQYLVRIVQRDKTQVPFAVGWLKRAAVMQAYPFLLT